MLTVSHPVATNPITSATTAGLSYGEDNNASSSNSWSNPSGSTPSTITRETTMAATVDEQDRGEGSSRTVGAEDSKLSVSTADRVDGVNSTKFGGVVNGHQGGSGSAEQEGQSQGPPLSEVIVEGDAQGVVASEARTAPPNPKPSGSGEQPPGETTAPTSSSTTNPPPSTTQPPSDSSPTSPSTSNPSHSSPLRMDLATFPPQELLKLLASLLQQIAQANDALRPDNGDVDGTSEPSTPQTTDGASHLAAAGATPPPQQSTSPSPSRPGSIPNSRRASTAELVIPPYRPRNRDGEVTSPGAGAGSSSSSTNPPTLTSESSSTSVNTTTPTTPSHSRPPPISRSSSVSNQIVTYPPIFTASRQSLSHPSSILCFHARNVPSISIESYLQRILKYCPITNEVFLSLLVYFDRMSKNGYGRAAQIGHGGRDLSGAVDQETAAGHGQGQGIRGFAIDSYNVHRLVIAGITVASKFFSDVFYTNSRYAKVGGLPQSELNQLELQFLLLNDFRLVIPLEEMQRYADQLLAYQREKERREASSTEESTMESSQPVEAAPVVVDPSAPGAQVPHAAPPPETPIPTSSNEAMEEDGKPQGNGAVEVSSGSEDRSSTPMDTSAGEGGEESSSGESGNVDGASETTVTSPMHE